MTFSDAELVDRARDGDREAYALIIKRYERLVFNIVFHVLGSSNDVEDIAQEVFLKLFRNLDRYDTTRPLKNWLGRIAVNRSLDELRRRKANPVKSFGDFEQSEESDASDLYAKFAASHQLSEEEAGRCFRLLQSALDTLPEKDRTVFVLRELEDMEYSQIAEILGTSELGVRIRLSRTRQRLEEELKRRLYE